jgi:hypothetical protein
MQTSRVFLTVLLAGAPQSRRLELINIFGEADEEANAVGGPGAALSVQAGAAVPEKRRSSAPQAAGPANAGRVWASRVLTQIALQAGMPLDDAMSEKIFDRYFKSLDAEKLFFTQADIDRTPSAHQASTTPSTAKT